MNGVVILGAGMAGLGAAYHFQEAAIESIVYEKENTHGGHARSYFVNGFVYDDGPHVSFTKNERVKALFAESVAHEYETVDAKVNNYWKGLWIKHPVQCNLFNLPLEMKIDIVSDFIDSMMGVDNPISNYEEWLLASYGRSFATNFPMEYTKKFHTTTADQLGIDWLGPRLYKPNIREIIHGALTLETDNVHYVPTFRYPKKGGFIAYLKFLAKASQIQFNHSVVHIDPRTHQIKFEHGKSIDYQYLVSSIPLPELISMIEGVPDNVLEASKKLACSKCVIVNIGIDRADISPAHWSYFYDQDICFSRCSFPHMQSENNAPPGHGIIQAEVYYSSKYKPLAHNPDNCIEPVIKDLKKCGLIKQDDAIVLSDAKLIPYANVIFDLERSSALSIIEDYLDSINIQCCGRYGLWGYHWTDESFVSGEEAAAKVVSRLQSR